MQIFQVIISYMAAGFLTSGPALALCLSTPPSPTPSSTHARAAFRPKLD